MLPACLFRSVVYTHVDCHYDAMAVTMRQALCGDDQAKWEEIEEILDCGVEPIEFGFSNDGIDFQLEDENGCQSCTYI